MKHFKIFAPPAETDDIPERIHKRLHIIYFFLKCVIGAMIFMVFYVMICVRLFDVPEAGDEESPFLRHEYCGTFYVEVNRENSFGSQETYEAYLQKLNEAPAKSAAETISAVIAAAAAAVTLILLLTKKLPKFLSERAALIIVIYGACLIFYPNILDAAMPMCYITLFLALRCGDRKTVFKNKASDYFFVSGAVWLARNIAYEIISFVSMPMLDKDMTGVFSHPRYYFQFYDIFGIPFVILAAGLMLRRQELRLNGGDTRRNTSLLRTGGYAALGGTAAFVIYRLSVRIFEVIKVTADSGYTVRLPFTVMDHIYNRLIDLPHEFANSPEIYRKAVIYRFVKDCPVFIPTSAALFLFVRVLFAIAKGELNTAANRKRLNISMILLAAASLWFNIMGIPELGIFNEGFTGIYGEVVFTMALRSKTEPMLYALVLWFFKTYLQTIPEE